jgi:WD40 repeat protein
LKKPRNSTPDLPKFPNFNGRFEIQKRKKNRNPQFEKNEMQLKYYQSILQPSTGITKVTAVCWSPNGKKLAVCTTDRIVLLFDENGVKKDKFSTKPIDKVFIYLQISFVHFLIPEISFLL